MSADVAHRRSVSPAAETALSQRLVELAQDPATIARALRCTHDSQLRSTLAGIVRRPVEEQPPADGLRDILVGIDAGQVHYFDRHEFQSAADAPVPLEFSVGNETAWPTDRVKYSTQSVTMRLSSVREYLSALEDRRGLPTANGAQQWYV